MQHKKAHLSAEERTGILDEARTCIGTRFHFNQRERGLALDCVGLVRHVMKACGFYCPPDVGYTARSCWGRRIYLDARDGMDELALDDAAPGCVLMLWLSRDVYPQHLAFFTGSSLIHAHDGQRQVCEEAFSQPWARRVLAAFELRRDSGASHRVAETPPVDGRERRYSPRGGSRGQFANWGADQPSRMGAHRGSRV